LLLGNLTNRVNPRFYNYLKTNNASKSYPNQNIKALINFAKLSSPNGDFYQISKKEEKLAYLNTKIKSKEDNPDGKWMRTWNDYLQRIKYFIRWIYNEKQRIDKNLGEIEPSDWKIPTIVKIKNKV
jgi:integrase/recombinase XerD